MEKFISLNSIKIYKMTKKSFFRERNAKQIQGLNIKKSFQQRGLAERVMDLDPSLDALEIRTELKPGKSFFNPKTKKYDLTGEEASRKNFKYGNRIALSHPKTKRDCFWCPDIPLQIRHWDFEKNLEKKKEEEIKDVSYSVRFFPLYGCLRA